MVLRWTNSRVVRASAWEGRREVGVHAVVQAELVSEFAQVHAELGERRRTDGLADQCVEVPRHRRRSGQMLPAFVGEGHEYRAAIRGVVRPLHESGRNESVDECRDVVAMHPEGRRDALVGTRTDLVDPCQYGELTRRQAELGDAYGEVLRYMCADLRQQERDGRAEIGCRRHRSTVTQIAISSDKYASRT